MNKTSRIAHLMYIFVLFVSLFHICSCTQYVARGASLPKPIYRKLFFAYNLISGSNVTLKYYGTGSGSGREAIRNQPDQYDFVASDSPLSLETLSEYNYILTFPILGCSLFLV